MGEGIDIQALEAIYSRYNRRQHVHPDPLEFLYRYDAPADREVAGLLAAALAYGRVRQILVSVERVLDRLGPRPAEFLARSSERRLHGLLGDFRHRFHGADQVEALLRAVRRVRAEQGSLERCFQAGYDPADADVGPALSHLVGCLARAGCGGNHLISDPARGSACKRMMLFLRWMVRRDEVDVGGWEGVCPSKLLVPLDTHMHRIGLRLGLTARRAADLRTAREVTAGFARLCPHDPVRYDFALTRVGMRGELDKIPHSQI